MLKRNFMVLIPVFLMLMLFFGCVSTADMSIVPGDVYFTEERLYSSPLNSVFGTPEITFTVKDDALERENNGSLMEIPVEEWGWVDFPYSKEEWDAMFFDMHLFPLKEYGKIMYQPIDLFSFMLLADGEIWIVQLFPDNRNEGAFWVWSIDRLALKE